MRPCDETVCSNILAFFMDPEEAHGFETLMLDALLSVEASTEANTVIGGNVSVEQEVHTNRGRIDILVMSDDHAILIENKIHARVNNPFDDYSDYLDRVAGNRIKHKFLLTLSTTDAGKKWEFMNVTHEKLVGQIRSLMGNYVSYADTRHLTLFLDFLNTLENLQGESHMNQEFVRLLSERGDDAESLFAELTSFKDELRKKVRSLNALIELNEHETVEQRFYRENTRLFDDVLYNVRVSESLLVSIDVIVNPRGWRIYIWPRQGNRSELAVLLQHLEITFEEGSLLIPSTQDRRFVYSTRFAYNENLNNVRVVLQELIDKLAASHEREV